MKKILIVEDDVDIRESLEFALRAEGRTAVLAENGRAALDILDSMPEPPSLILLDLYMDVMDGKTFLEVLARDHATTWAKIPVILTSAAGEAALAELPKSLKKVRKPYDLGLLLDLVSEYCD